METPANRTIGRGDLVVVVRPDWMIAPVSSSRESMWVPLGTTLLVLDRKHANRDRWPSGYDTLTVLHEGFKWGIQRMCVERVTTLKAKRAKKKAERQNKAQENP